MTSSTSSQPASRTSQWPQKKSPRLAMPSAPGTPNPGVRSSTMMPRMPIVMSSELSTGMREEAHDHLGPVGTGLAHLGVPEAELGEDLGQVVGPGVGDLELERLVGGQREQLALLDDPRDFHVGVHHRLGHERRAAPGLRGGAELLAHVGDGLLGHRLRGCPRLPDVYRRGGPDRRAGRHHDPLRGEADQGAGGDRPLVHEGDRPHLAREAGRRA